GEVVAARTQRLERRRKACREFDEAADGRRRPLAHRHTHALELLIQARSADAFDAYREAVGALALPADLDETPDPPVPGGRAEHGMRDQGALEGGGGKSGGERRRAHKHRKGDRTVANEDRDRHRRGKQRGRRPRGRLTIEGEISDDSGTESDREPRYQPTG